MNTVHCCYIVLVLIKLEKEPRTVVCVWNTNISSLLPVFSRWMHRLVITFTRILCTTWLNKTKWQNSGEISSSTSVICVGNHRKELDFNWDYKQKRHDWWKMIRNEFALTASSTKENNPSAIYLENSYNSVHQHRIRSWKDAVVTVFWTDQRAHSALL